MNDSIAHISFSFFWQLDIQKELEDLDYLSPLFFFFLIYLLFSTGSQKTGFRVTGELHFSE